MLNRLDENRNCIWNTRKKRNGKFQNVVEIEYRRVQREKLIKSERVA